MLRRLGEKNNTEIYPWLIKLPPPATLPPYVQTDFLFCFPSAESKRCGRCNLMAKHVEIFTQGHFLFDSVPIR